MWYVAIKPDPDESLNRLYVTAPYNVKFITEVRSLNSFFDRMSRVWVVPKTQEDKLRKLCLLYFCTDGDYAISDCRVRLRLDKGSPWLYPGAALFHGFELVSRRSSGALQWNADAHLIQGGFSDTPRYRRDVGFLLCPRRNTILEFGPVSFSVAQYYASERASWLEVVESTPDREQTSEELLDQALVGLRHCSDDELLAECRRRGLFGQRELPQQLQKYRKARANRLLGVVENLSKEKAKEGEAEPTPGAELDVALLQRSLMIPHWTHKQPKTFCQKLSPDPQPLPPALADCEFTPKLVSPFKKKDNEDEDDLDDEEDDFSPF